MEKVFAIMGSPRKNKNTNKLLEIFVDSLNKNDYEVEKVYLIDKKIENCNSCYYCGKNINCVIKDEMDEIYKGFDSDIIVFAAPIYFNSINGLSKSVVDRCQRYWSEKYLMGLKNDRIYKKGIFLSVGGAPFSNEQFYGAIKIMDLFFKAINTEYVGNYLVSNTDHIKIEDSKYIKDDMNRLINIMENGEKIHIQI